MIDRYRLALTGQNALEANYRIDPDTRIQGEQITFRDLVPLALEILEGNQYARGALRQTYSHVFLDEFQDATTEQYELVRAAFLNTDAILTAVGDVKQRIMAWAGALDRIMEAYADDFGAIRLPLYQNRRSAARLRRMQNRMIKEMDPGAASPDEDLVGDEGTIQVLHFDSQVEEAQAVADLVEGWLAADVSPREIAVLLRQQSKQVAGALGEELHDRGIPYRHEQESQDLAAEPAAALIFNFVWVVVGDRRPEAYNQLMRVAVRASGAEQAAHQFDSRLKRLLRASRATVRSASFAGGDLEAWRPVISEFLDLVSRPVLTALSPAYQQGSRLDDVIGEALRAVGTELAVDGDPIQALKRLSELDAVRILTIHKCKGLEFEKVVVLGVERELFWGDAAMFEFFVAISRAKEDLVLTDVKLRARPKSPVKYWRENRNAHDEFLGYAVDDIDDEDPPETGRPRF